MSHLNHLITTITVNQILMEKGHQVWHISPDTSVYFALQEMADKNIGAILVMDGTQLVGILSERDYARKVVLRGKSSVITPVKEIMTEHVVTVKPTDSLADCMALMTEQHFRHLPVMENNQLVGLISIGDVVKAVISEQAFVIEQLENYIVGERSG